MSWNRFLSAVAGLCATAGMAWAAADAPKSEASSTNAQIEAAEQGVPASTDYPNRKVPQKATNDQIDSAETTSPSSVDNRNRVIPDGGDGNAEWRASESANPAEQSAEPAKR